jgi:hypothetical protein
MQIKGSNPRFEDLKVMRDWPGASSEKVPSEMSYSASLKGCRQWGKSIDEDSFVLRWTKLELQPQKRVKELQQLSETLKGLSLLGALNSDPDVALDNAHLGKDHGGIIRDYLKKVARYWYDHMAAELATVLKNVPLDIIVTHPVVSFAVNIEFHFAF